MGTDLPDLATLVDPLIGRPYAEIKCWPLCRYLYQEGFGAVLDDHPAHAWKHVAEVVARRPRRPPRPRAALGSPGPARPGDGKPSRWDRH